MLLTTRCASHFSDICLRDLAFSSKWQAETRIQSSNIASIIDLSPQLQTVQIHFGKNQGVWTQKSPGMLTSISGSHDRTRLSDLKKPKQALEDGILVWTWSMLLSLTR